MHKAGLQEHENPGGQGNVRLAEAPRDKGKVNRARGDDVVVHRLQAQYDQHGNEDIVDCFELLGLEHLRQARLTGLEHLARDRACVMELFSK